MIFGQWTGQPVQCCDIPGVAVKLSSLMETRRGPYSAGYSHRLRFAAGVQRRADIRAGGQGTVQARGGKRQPPGSESLQGRGGKRQWAQPVRTSAHTRQRVTPTHGHGPQTGPTEEAALPPTAAKGKGTGTGTAHTRGSCACSTSGAGASGSRRRRCWQSCGRFSAATPTCWRASRASCRRG